VVIWLTAASVNLANINAGVIGLACNLAVVGIVEAVLRVLSPGQARLVAVRKG
jgi:hypothetical protein